MAMPAATPPVRRLTRSEYHLIGETGVFDQDRIELIHGIVVYRPVIGAEHADAVDQLTVLLVTTVGSRARVRIQQPLAASDDSEPEPDVSLVPPGRYLDDHPDVAYLVVEVAKHSLAFDRGAKAAVYAAMGVPQYWVVNLVDGIVEVFEDPAPDGYQRVMEARRGDRLPIQHFSDMSIAVSDLLPPA